MRVLKYNDYNQVESLINYFVSNLNVSDSFEYKENVIIKDIINKLNINLGIYDELNYLIEPSTNIIKSLVANTSLNIELNDNSLNMLSLTVLMVYYLESFKSKFINNIKPYENSDILRDDIKNLLEELKLSGIGNGVVKKLVECFKTISIIVKELFINKDKNVNCIFCIKDNKILNVLNTISTMIIEYNFNIDNFNNLYNDLKTLGFPYLISKLNNKLELGLDTQDVVKSDSVDKIEIITEN